MSRTIRAALAALTLMAIVATPVAAGKPIAETFEESGTFTIPCETVTLVEEYSQSVVVTTWFDADGEVTRGHARVRFDGTITGPGSALRLSEAGRFTSFIDFGSRTVRQIGLVYKFSAPDLGVVAHEVGSLTLIPGRPPEAKGPHDVLDNGVEALICPLFE